MQQPARNGLTTAQVTSLIRDAPAIEVASGVELLDISLTVLGDLTDNFVGGTVSRDSYATLHGTATLGVTQDLDWATAILRPYVTLTDGTVSARFNMGAYLTSSPETVAGLLPVTHAVDGYDILHWLNTPAGEAYVVSAGTLYLDAVEAVLQAQGIKSYLIDRTSSSVLPTDQVWALDTQTTWLNVINDLLSSIGYQGIWSDWDGNLRVNPYLVPAQREPEFVYDTAPATSMLTPERKANRDLFNAPNRWVFYNSSDPSGAAPTEGNGLLTVVNNNVGPTSVEARQRVITAVVQVNVVDQAALVALAQARIDADLRLSTTFDVGTSINPLHWHFDRIFLNDPALGPLSDILVTKWSMPLNGPNMAQSWSLL